MPLKVESIYVKLLQAFLVVPRRANQQNPTEQPYLCNAGNTGDSGDEHVGNLCLFKIIVCFSLFLY